MCNKKNRTIVSTRRNKKLGGVVIVSWCNVSSEADVRSVNPDSDSGIGPPWCGVFQLFRKHFHPLSSFKRFG